MMLGTGLGLFRAAKGADTAERVVGELRLPDGSGPVSSNLVVRYARPGELLALRPPRGRGRAAREPRADPARATPASTCEPVVELGQADFHIIQAAGDRLRRGRRRGDRRSG